MSRKGTFKVTKEGVGGLEPEGIRYINKGTRTNISMQRRIQCILTVKATLVMYMYSSEATLQRFPACPYLIITMIIRNSSPSRHQGSDLRV
jgi:hypothetical protein